MGRVKKDYVVFKEIIKNKVVWRYRLGNDANKRFTTKAKSKTEAERIARQAWEQEQKESSSNPSITLKEYIDLKGFYIWDKCPHIANVKRVGKKPITKRYAYIKRKIMDKYILGQREEIEPAPFLNKPMNEINSGEIAEWANRCVAISRVSASKALEALKLIFRYADGGGFITGKLPTSSIESISQNNNVVRNLTDDEEEDDIEIFEKEELRTMFFRQGNKYKVLPWRNIEEKVMFMIACLTGMRRAEILALHWNKIHFENKPFIRVDTAFKDQLCKEEGLPKWNIIRDVPLPDILIDWLKKLLEEQARKKAKDLLEVEKTDRVFEGLTYNHWDKGFKKAMKNLKIPSTRNNKKVKPHSFRHTLNTLLTAMNVNTDVIGKTFGWTQRRTQLNYQHLKLAHTFVQAQAIDDYFKKKRSLPFTTIKPVSLPETEETIKIREEKNKEIAEIIEDVYEDISDEEIDALDESF